MSEMNLSIGVQKKKIGDIEKAKGHNLRLHPTKSQLPQPNWLRQKGLYTIVAWREEVMQKALSLVKRKDAVVAIELTIQVGDQTHWRELPTAQNPYGDIKKGVGPKMDALFHGSREAIAKQFGEANIVSMVLHVDESSPHVHAIVVPINDGKLQSKHWIGGKKKMEGIWKSIHQTMNQFLPCTYKPAREKELGDALGGQRHDPTKAAGAKNGPSPFNDLHLSLYEKLKQKIKPDELKKWLVDKVASMQKIIDELNEKLANAFSRIKRMELQAAELAKKLNEAEAMQARAQTNERKSEQRAADYQKRIEQLEALLAERDHIEQLQLNAKRDGRSDFFDMGRRAGAQGSSPSLR